MTKKNTVFSEKKQLQKLLNNNSEILLTLKEVTAFVSCSKSSIYRYINQGIFPKPHKLDPDKIYSAARWKHSEVQEWIKSRTNPYDQEYRKIKFGRKQ